MLIGLLFQARRGHLDPTHVKLFVEMGEFSPGVLEEELADENEGCSKHVDGQENDVGQDRCRIFAPKNQLVRGEESQFTHEPENQGWQEGDGDEKDVCDHSWFLHLETSRAFPRHSLRHGSRAVSEGSPEARHLFRWRPPMEKTGPQKRARVGGKVECGALRLGRGGLAAPGATRVQNRRWRSPECCQRARMNREDLFLSRCALPEQGVQREWPSTITNGQQLVLMFRLPQIIFF